MSIVENGVVFEFELLSIWMELYLNFLQVSFLMVKFNSSKWYLFCKYLLMSIVNCLWTWWWNSNYQFWKYQVLDRFRPDGDNCNACQTVHAGSWQLILVDVTCAYWFSLPELCISHLQWLIWVSGSLHYVGRAFPSFVFWILRNIESGMNWASC